MEQFPHLKFVQKVIGRPRLFGGGSPNPTSQENRNNRQAHSNNLIQQTGQLRANWSAAYLTRDEERLAPLDEETIPVFLEINPDIINAEFDLSAFGIEIISEEENGFIIGASVDNLRTLEEKINGFVSNNHGTAKIADFWRIIDGDRHDWRPQNILSEELYNKWSQIQDDQQYALEVGIAFDRPLGPEPDPTKKGGGARLEKYRQAQQARDDTSAERETHFENFVKHYGEITSSIVWLEDCFGCEVKISGRGLKDLVFNYPYVFEVLEIEEIGSVTGSNSETDLGDLEILAPEGESPVIGVIDSGIMENHRFLDLAIDGRSQSYLSGDNSTADHVQGGGHGTRVAGAILYPLGISKYSSPYQLPYYLRNLRVLNNRNDLLHRYPAELIKKILEDNDDCGVFNHSINSIIPHRKRHMSAWAAWIDRESHKNNVLFVVSAGNISRAAIREFFRAGNVYPSYLDEPYCGIANPGQSSFAITVGSINHAAFDDGSWQSLGIEQNVSAFSRIGPGIWNTIKPDVVEFGGGFVISKNGSHHIKEIDRTSPELLRSTMHGGSYNGFDAVGTSFAAPKVTHVVSALTKLYPGESINLFRALLIQGARLPDGFFLAPTRASLRHFGYGIPSLDRVTRNTDYRVSFYNTGSIQTDEGHIYSLKVPQSLRGQGDEYEILIEVTLSFTAGVRRTRQKIKSYLSTWVDWDCSKLDEAFEDFKDYALKEVNGVESQYDSEERKNLESIPWNITNRIDHGPVEGFSRNNNSVQKDWAIVKSYQLPEEIGFVVRGHQGWDKKHEPVPYAFVVSLEILGSNIPIYEAIRLENEIEQEI